MPSSNIYQPAEGQIYSKYETDILGPRIRARFKLTRNFGPPSEYGRFWAEARQAAKNAGRLPMAVIGIPGKLTCLVPSGLSKPGTPLDSSNFEVVTEWQLLELIDQEAQQSDD